MTSRIKRYFAVLLVAGSLFVSQVACFEDGAAKKHLTQPTVISTNSGAGWKKCASLSCTFKKNGNIKSCLKGSKIDTGTATPLGGTWK